MGNITDAAAGLEWGNGCHSHLSRIQGHLGVRTFNRLSCLDRVPVQSPKSSSS